MLMIENSTFQVNMDRPCPFWPDERECGSKECGVDTCDDEVPLGLRKPPTRPNGSQHTVRRFFKAENCVTTCAFFQSKEEPCDNSNNFDPLDKTISSATEEQLKDMDLHDESEDKFCDVDGTMIYSITIYSRHNTNYIYNNKYGYA
jgi:hypothetical protein